MSARFDHLIIAADDPVESAAFYRRFLEAEDAPSWSVFTNLRLDDGVLLQLARPPQHCPPQHYAFHLDEEHFDRALERLRVDGRDHWADPRRDRPGEVNREHGGRGVYLLDPVGHLVELLTGSYL